MHSGDLHVAPERNRAYAVLDSLAPHRCNRGGEPEIEPARTHPDRAGDVEVPRLVEEHEQRKPEDGNADVHAGARVLSASSRADASASTRSSRSRADAPSLAASVSSTTSAIPRNGRRPSRNAATAISFAALNTHGNVPPCSPAPRASARSGNVSRSGA